MYQHIVEKRKAALELAKQAYDQALKKREGELGRLCLECGLGELDRIFLKEQFAKIKTLGSSPKSSKDEPGSSTTKTKSVSDGKSLSTRAV